MITFEVGDIILSWRLAKDLKKESFVSKAIRLFTRGKGEAPTRYSHGSMVTHRGLPMETHVIEAVPEGTKINPLWTYGADRVFMAYRLRDCPPAHVLLERCEEFLGKPYPYTDLLLHWIDWGIARVFQRRDAYVARRIGGRVPTCMELVCRIHRRLFGKASYNQVTPDDVDDWCRLEGQALWLCEETTYASMIEGA